MQRRAFSRRKASEPN